MKIIRGILALCVLSASLATAKAAAQSIPVTVDCSSGQSLNRALSKLDKQVATTVSVMGTCTEYVQVSGFQNLTLKGLPGAALVQPATSAPNLIGAVLTIVSSQSVTVNGFSLQADTSSGSAIGIGHGSRDIRLRNLEIVGGDYGISIYENSQVSLAYVTSKDAGFSPLGVFDLSDVHLEHSTFTSSAAAAFYVGMYVGTSHITMYDTSIKNMQVGIYAYANSIIDILAFDTYYPYGSSNEVTITGSPGTNYDGVDLSSGSSLNVTGTNQQATRLVINQPGQAYGGTTGGVLVSDRSLLEASSNLVITGSQGQGIVVLNNSHATLSGATITGSGHGGVVASNLSTIDIATGTPTQVGGSAVDLFCDSSSRITGSANLAGAPTAQCSNLLPKEFTLP
jgi:hypothetical protein